MVARSPEKEPPPIRDIRGVVFDLDGTLYTARFLGLTIATGLLRELGLLKKLFAVRKIERPKRYDNLREFKNGFANTFSELAGISPDRALDWYENRFMPRFTYAIGKRGRRRAGLTALLEQLKASGVKLAVISDFGMVNERLEAIGLPPDLFDIAEGAETFGVMKPTDIPFVHIADAWQIPIENLLLIGDRDDHDRRSADLAGAQFIGIAGTKNEGADFLAWDEALKVIAAAARPRRG